MAAHKLVQSCIFCKIVRGEIPCHKLVETEHVLAFLDINPLSDGHAVRARCVRSPREPARAYAYGGSNYTSASSAWAWTWTWT